MKEIAIFWFRRDLRLEDNAGLFSALKGNYPVLPVFIFDPNILNHLTDKSDARVSFIHQRLENINQQLKPFKSSIFTFFKEPKSAFEELLSMFAVREVFTNRDYEPYALKRDEVIRKFLHERNVKFHTFKDQVIFEKLEICKKDGSPYTVFTPYSTAWKYLFSQHALNVYPSEELLDNFYMNKELKFLALKELGFENSMIKVPACNLEEHTIRNYHLNRNYPSVHGTSNLSVQLRFGTVSIRRLVKMANSMNEQWLNELIWREFFMMILFCFPNCVEESFKPKYRNIEWINNEAHFKAWCEGKTGYPLVDAGMRELNSTGLMHNRVRMVTASFLTKHLWIDWRWGEAYFAEKLLDYDLSANNGNWQWAAGCGCDAAPYFRIFNPIEQERKFDPEQIYINKWLGEDISLPIIDHAFARDRAIRLYKKYLNEE